MDPNAVPATCKCGLLAHFLKTSANHPHLGKARRERTAVTVLCNSASKVIVKLATLLLCLYLTFFCQRLMDKKACPYQLEKVKVISVPIWVPEVYTWILWKYDPSKAWRKQKAYLPEGAKCTLWECVNACGHLPQLSSAIRSRLCERYLQIWLFEWDFYLDAVTRDKETKPGGFKKVIRNKWE